jgi:putative flippase GtrA
VQAQAPQQKANTVAAIQALGSQPTDAAPPAAAAPVLAAGQTLRQYVRFLVVGASNAIVDLGLLNVLTALRPPHDALIFAGENSIAVACALINSYVWNARWTFRGQGTRTLRERALFFAQALLNLLLNNVVLLTVMGLLPGGQGVWPALATNIAKVCAMLAASTTSFILLHAVVFRSRQAA